MCARPPNLPPASSDLAVVVVVAFVVVVIVVVVVVQANRPCARARVGRVELVVSTLVQPIRVADLIQLDSYGRASRIVLFDVARVTTTAKIVVHMTTVALARVVQSGQVSIRRRRSA